MLRVDANLLIRQVNVKLNSCRKRKRCGGWRQRPSQSERKSSGSEILIHNHLPLSLRPEISQRIDVLGIVCCMNSAAYLLYVFAFATLQKLKTTLSFTKLGSGLDLANGCSLLIATLD